MYRSPRATFALVLFAAWAGVPSPAQADAPVPPPPPAATRPTESVIDPKVAEATRGLADRDFRVRERATRALWSLGKAAEPALRDAAGSGDPEVARRARTILSHLEYGITPDMPAEVVDLLHAYRNGKPVKRRESVAALARCGAPGARALLNLLALEPDGGMRTAIDLTLSRSSRELATALLTERDDGGGADLADAARVAGRVLAVAAQTGDDDTAAMDYAALLLVNGGLDEAIHAAQARLAELTPRDHRAKGASGGGAAAVVREFRRLLADDARPPGTPESRRAAKLLAYLCRAKGDYPAARAASEAAGDDRLLWNLMVEAGDWRRLATRGKSGWTPGLTGPGAAVSGVCFTAAFHRLAGDEPGLDRVAVDLRTAADREPTLSWEAAEGLFLNGRVDLGTDLLVRHDQLATAVEFATQRLAFDEVPRLVERARARGDAGDVARVDIAAARAAWFTGEAKRADELLKGAADDCRRRVDFNGLAAAAEAAREIGNAERAHWCLVQALQVAATQPAMVIRTDGRDPLTELFANAGFRHPERAAGWWGAFRLRAPRDPAGTTLERLRAIDSLKMPADDVRTLCSDAANRAGRLPSAQHYARLELVADTLAAYGLREDAARHYKQLAETTKAEDPARAAGLMSKLAGLAAEAGRWDEAAEHYRQAWALDRTNPVPLYLSGVALARAGAGRASLAQDRQRRARLVPLSEDRLRQALHDAMAGQKQTVDAARERDVILRTATFLSQPRSIALRRAGDEARAAGDALRAAELWEQAFLDNNNVQTTFVTPWANVSMPALVRRTRAAGLIKAGDVAAGLKEADAALAMSPGDADGLIEVVNALDAAGRKPQADTLYDRVAAGSAKLCETYPASGPLHNLRAWAAVKCDREPDAALRHAKRAVELQPTNTASLDTLAEVYFRRGNVAEAIQAMQKCGELEPDEPHHQQQLKRFRAALAAPGSQPSR